LSNASTLDIDEMASVLDASRQSRFAGWHFFSPAHIMKLVEVVNGKATSSETTALLQALTKQVGKIGVVVGNCDGFCGNRLLKPYSAEAFMILTEGQGTIDSVDRAFLQFGMALGPFQMGDLAGNDVAYNIRVERGWAKRKPSDPQPPNRPDRYCELADDMVTQHGRLGQKVGKGWYDYDMAVGKGRKPMPSAEMNALVSKYAARSGRQLSEEEIIERVFYPLVNEGFKCLEEGIARIPSDIDVVYLYGYGWPVWRGGPMYWADHEVGLERLLSKLERFSRQYPGVEHYVPSALLRKCVSMGVTVEEYYKNGSQSSRSKL
jgi:3-hydroxyacyl-CoA dehydrogenase